MSYQVRQLSFGEILDQSFKVLKDNFVVLTGIMAVFYVPYALLMALITPDPAAGAAGIPAWGVLVPAMLGVLVMLAVLPLSQLAVTRAVSEAYLNTPLTLGEAYKAAVKCYGQYLGTCLLVGLAVMGLMFLLFVPGIYFGVAWSLVGPVAVVEGVFGGAAMKRSRALAKGYWWRTWSVLFVATIIAGIVSAGVGAVLGSIPLLGPVLTGGVQSIAAAYTSIALVVLYVDLRCRHEDFDLQLLANQVAKGAPLAREPAMGTGI
jgi:hypothetical protein